MALLHDMYGDNTSFRLGVFQKEVKDAVQAYIVLSTVEEEFDSCFVSDDTNNAIINYADFSVKQLTGSETIGQLSKTNLPCSDPTKRCQGVPG